MQGDMQTFDQVMNVHNARRQAKLLGREVHNARRKANFQAVDESA